MTDKRARLDVQVDATGATAAFEEIKTGAKGMGQAMKDGTKAGGDGMRQMAQESEAAAEKQDSSARRLIQSMERWTAQAKAAGKGQAEFYLELAKTRGIDTSTEAFQRQIATIRELEAAQGKAGISAKQTAAAMRGVPAQFTDIFTSLQGGQAPLTVLLQQGGQLKDMFGGVGNAARALGGYVMGLVNPYTLAAASVGVLALAYMRGSEEANAYNKALILSGNAVGTTASQMQVMAQSIAGISGTQGAAAEALAIFAQSGQVARGNLEAFTGAALRYASATGTAVTDIAKNFADLAKDPLSATLKLNDGMNYLTVSTYQQIKALAEQGRTTEAAEAAQKAYADAMNERTPELLKNLGFIQKIWGGIASFAKGAWDAMLGIGREDGTETLLRKTQESIAQMKAVIAQNNFLDRPEVLKQQLKALEEQESVLQSQVREMRRGVAIQAEQAAQVKALAAWDQETLKLQSDKVTLEKQIVELRNKGIAAGKTEQEIAVQIAALRDKSTKKTAAPSGAADSELANLQARFAELKRWQQALVEGQPLEDKRTAGEKQLAIIREKFAISSSDAEKAQLKLRESVLESIIPIEQLQQVEKARIKDLEELDKARVKEIETAHKKTESIQKEVEQQQQQYAALGLTKDQLAELAAVRLEDAAATAEQNAKYERNYEKNVSLASEYENQAKKLRELAALKRQTASKEVAIDEAKKTADEWKRTAETIERSLTDALMRGFESGKSFGANLKDTLENLFKTMVLRPYIQAVVGGITGLGSLGAMAGQGAGGMPGVGMLGGAASLFNSGFMNTITGSGTMAGLGAAGQMGGLKGAAMGLGAIAPWALGAYALYSGLKQGPRVTNAENLVGSFSSNGASLDNVQQWSQSGGFLRGSKSGTVRGSLEGGALDQSLDSAIARMYDTTRKYAEVLGLSADAVNSYQKSINISLQGLSPEERDRKVQEALSGFGDGLAQVLGVESASALQQLAERVLSERSNLELQILNLQGNTEAIRKRERDAIHETNQALYDQVKALEDAKTLAQKAAAIEQERLGLQGQLDQLMGNTAAIRNRERDALDETNRALYDQIRALEATQSAASSAAAALESAAQERLGLQNHLDQLLGNTTAIRARERAALQDTNRALYDQITALEETKAAAEKSAAVLQERLGLQNQLDQLLGNTTAIRARERSALDQTNRALYDQIKQQEDLQTTIQNQAQAMQAQQQAAEAMRQAWSSIGDTLRDQVQKIRTGLSVSAGQGYVALAAQFASATAKARSGDQVAAGSLVGLSQSLLEQAAGGVTSRVEYQRIAALTAASLDNTLAATGQPMDALTNGSNAAGATFGATFGALTGLPATLAPVPTSLSPAPISQPQSDPSAQMMSALRSLSAEVAALRASNSAENVAIVQQTAATARILSDVTPKGTSINVRSVT